MLSARGNLKRKFNLSTAGLRAVITIKDKKSAIKIALICTTKYKKNKKKTVKITILGEIETECLFFSKNDIPII